MREQEEALARRIEDGPRVSKATTQTEKPTEEFMEAVAGDAFTRLRVHAKSYVRADDDGTWPYGDRRIGYLWGLRAQTRKPPN